MALGCQDPVKAIKTDTRGAREEETGIGPSLISLENSVKQLKREITKCKASAKLVDGLVNVVLKAVTEDDFNVDQETLVLIEKATSALTEAQSGSAAAGNGGGHQGSSTAHN
ncbi:hypothetical protein V6N13_088521 [Hibiscus sabdariffa]